MAQDIIIGRDDEQKTIKNYIDSKKAELIAVYGRRRVGKTYLIKSFFNNNFDFAFTGIYDVSKTVQLAQFQKVLEQYWGKPVKRIKDWFKAFDLLREYFDTLQKDKIIAFIDEIPWLDTPKSNFLAAFSQFWNDWASTKNNFKLLVCGSATTWMLSKFIGNKGGIYGRISRAIWLRPFTLSETQKFLKEIKGIALNHRQTLDIYMILGGIPYYLDMLEKDIPLTVNIDNLFFKESAPLRNEFDFLFRSLFLNSKIYSQIVEALAQKLKGLTRRELLETLKIKEGGMITDALENLIKCDFIRKYTAIGKSERDALYQLTDLFSLFYLRYIANNNGLDEHFWTKISGKPPMTSWSGYAFEQVCLHHISQIKKALGISGIISNIYSWSCRPFTDKNGAQWQGGQIDLVIDRADGVINLCEIKYVSGLFSIDTQYAAHLRERMSLFTTVTKTTKAIHHTFITTYGIKQNINSDIVQSEVTMDGLWC
ncbi:MAG: ATP-binding protein [Bacteroidales bacterium]|nr:ATP-binding protein [Bacteroidales bacterium]